MRLACFVPDSEFIALSESSEKAITCPSKEMTVRLVASWEADTHDAPNNTTGNQGVYFCDILQRRHLDRFTNRFPQILEIDRQKSHRQLSALQPRASANADTSDIYDSLAVHTVFGLKSFDCLEEVGPLSHEILLA